MAVLDKSGCDLSEAGRATTQAVVRQVQGAGLGVHARQLAKSGSLPRAKAPRSSCWPHHKASLQPRSSASNTVP